MGPITLFPTVYFIEKYNLVLFHDTFRLGLDYWSIIQQVTSNQQQHVSMALMPVRMEVLAVL